MTQKELDEVLRLHKMWLNGKEGGQRAILRERNLSGCNLSGFDLNGCDLSDCNLSTCDFMGCDLTTCDFRRSVMIRCDLSNCNLSGCDLSGCDLYGADLDYSCLPLWCGSLTAHFDDRQLKQIAYHLVRAGLHSKNASEETKRILSNPDLVAFANGFHRVDECGRIECENTV